MVQISREELDYLKKNLSTEQLMNIVSLKGKINKRKLKTGQKINENFSNTENDISLDDTGFIDFFENLDSSSKRIFKEVFGVFQNDSVGTSIQGKIYSLFQNFLKVADRHIVDTAE